MCSQSAFDVAGAGYGLVASAPAGPGEDEASGVGMVGSQAGHEAPQLGDGDGDEVGIGCRVPPFATPRTRAARASSARVVWRCQPVQERTSYWSRPTCRLASLKTSSIVQRAPMARTISASGVSVGANTK